MNILPNLLIIGAMKSGSTSLHNMLNGHPDIHMSEEKELNYFIKEINYDKGEGWYSSYFIPSYKYNGESSIGYTKKQQFKGVAKRISETIPNVKLIYIVREPIKRSISHYLDDLIYQQNNGIEYTNINSLLGNMKCNIIQCSSYSEQLLEYLNFFDREQILILKFDWLINQPDLVSKKLCEFLKLEYFDFTAVHINETKKKMVKSEIFKAISKSSFYKLLSNLLPKQIMQNLRKNKMVEILTKTELKSLSNELSDETIINMQNYFMVDLKKLEELTEIDFSDWYEKYDQQGTR